MQHHNRIEELYRDRMTECTIETASLREGEVRTIPTWVIANLYERRRNAATTTLVMSLNKGDNGLFDG